MHDRTFDVGAFINNQRIGAPQFMVMVLCAAIMAELGKLKAAPLLTGFRGAPTLDLAAVADIASRLGRFAAAHPEIAEIDINPLIVYSQHEGAIAVDALIVAR